MRKSRVLMLARLGLGLCCVAGCVLVCMNADAFLWLRSRGDFIDANSFSGLTDKSLCSLLGNVELVLVATGLALMASAGRGHRRHAPTLGFVIGRPSVGLTLLAVAVALCAILDQTFTYRGQTHFMISDDAMIEMRYAANLVRGLGPVYNAGERVEGYTAPLWVGLMALLHFLFHPSVATAPLDVLAASVGCLVVTIWAVEGAMRSFRAGAVWIAITGAAIIVDRDTIAWMLSGLETPGLTALVTGAVFAMAARREALFAVCLSLVPIMRSDGAVIAVPLGVCHLLLATDRRRALRLLGIATAPSLSYFAFRVWFYGAPLPNTYYLKSLSFGDRLVTGTGGFGLRLLYLHAVMMVGAAGALAQRKAPAWLRGAVAVAFLQIVYAILVGGDSFALARFYAPVLPIVAMACAWSLMTATRGAPRASTVPVMVAFGFLVPVFAPAGALGIQHPDQTFALGSLQTAELLRSNVPAGALITVSYAGTAPYFDPKHRFLDVLGKNDAHIARVRAYRSLAIGHNKFDFDYVYDVRRPQVAFIHHNCPNIERGRYLSPAEIENVVSKVPPWVTPFDVYEGSHPTFLKHYLRNPVHVVGRGDANYFGCLFVRDDSGLPMFWSANGPPPRMSRVSLDFRGGPPDDRVAFDTSFGPVVVLPDGTFVRRTAPRGRSDIDLWLDVSMDVSLELCFAGTPPDTVRVNEEAVELSRRQDCVSAVVATALLRRRSESTKVTIVGGRAALTRLSVQPLSG